MPSFTRSDLFDVRKGYTRVRWGDRSKVLDTELTEMQKILEAKVTTLAQVVVPGNGFVTKGALTYSSGTLTVPADIIVLNGELYQFVDPMTLSVGASTTVYLAIWEAEITYTDNIVRDGNLSGGVAMADNGILDSTFGAETTRRWQIHLQLVTDNSDGTKSYLPVASLDASSVVTDNRARANFGNPILANDPTDDMQATNKRYVDTEVAKAKKYQP